MYVASLFTTSTINSNSMTSSRHATYPMTEYDETDGEDYEAGDDGADEVNASFDCAGSVGADVLETNCDDAT